MSTVRLRHKSPAAKIDKDDIVTNGHGEKDVRDRSKRDAEEPILDSTSVLTFQATKDVLARVCFVGIFVIENSLHALNFEAEIDALVHPALRPLPREVAVCLHLIHVIFGFFGALFVILSGFDTAGRTALTKGTSMMLVFMSTITWTWWINRQGVPYWEMDPYPFWDARCSPDKRNRTVHILKNISIVGALTILQQVSKYEMQAQSKRPSFLEGLVTALRPWSFTATIAPQLVMLATLRCLLRHELPGYVLTFMLVLSIMAVQATANLINSYKDFEKGVDTKESAGDRTLVDGLVSMTTLKSLTAISLVWWCSFFIWSIFATKFSPVVIGMAFLGTALAIGYTAGPAPLKYMGLGDLTVFICFGPGVVAYSCAVLVGTVPWEVLMFTTPVTLYVIATLHANNHRDIETDRRAGARTVATRLGPAASLHYYAVLTLSAHVGALVAGYWFQCIGSLGSLFVLPQTIWLNVRIRRQHMLKDQDEETAKTTLIFGVALGLGIIIMPNTELSSHGMAAIALVVGVLKMFAD